MMTESPAAASVAAATAADELSKSFGANHVLDRLSLAVPPGTMLGLIGANGSGKTTLLQCLVGLLRPTAGTARVFGQSSLDLSSETRSRLGYVPQSPDLPPWLTVQKTAAYFAAMQPRWDAGYADDLIRRWHLDPKTRVGQLSGGRRQLLSILVALAHRPSLIVMDEPVASLDPRMRRDVLSVLQEQSDAAEQNDEPVTVILSSHLMSDLERAASHVAILREGRLALFEDLADLKESIIRLRISSGDPLPPPPLDAITLMHEGGTVVATIRQPTEPHWRDWARSHEATVLADHLSLDDLFVELA